MANAAPFIITISRQLGSGGAYVGKNLAKELKMGYADREIIRLAAKKLATLEENLGPRDEKLLSFWDSCLAAFPLSTPEGYVPPLMIEPTDRELYETEARIIERIADKAPAVLIGRCSSYILRARPNHLSVFLHAGTEYRARRVAELYHVDLKTAGEMLARSDEDRALYHKTFSGRVWTDAGQYDLAVDTGRLGLDNAVRLIRSCLPA